MIGLVPSGLASLKFDVGIFSVALHLIFFERLTVIIPVSSCTPFLISITVTVFKVTGVS